jgi:hypothetical protein
VNRLGDDREWRAPPVRLEERVERPVRGAAVSPIASKFSGFGVAVATSASDALVAVKFTVAESSVAVAE